MNKVTIDVVIPLYNGEKTILDTLHTVLAQARLPDHVYVVNDGSIDKGPEIVRSLHNPLITVIDTKHKGVSHARNRGIMVDFIPVGEETEIDRNMVDIISDPIVHLVRNAVDHGVEPPEEREGNGKPRAGTLVLRAYHSGGSVVVEIGDDGRGLDRDKIVRNAIAKGLVESDKGMSEGEVFNLIFQPGFSTAPEWVREMGFGAGMGLPNIKACADVMRLESTVGVGTHLEIIIYY